MSAPSPTRPKYCFSVFEVDPRAGELRKNGVRLRIQDQPFQVLLKLLAQPSQIVTREELKAALWPSDTFVDFDNGLNMAVKRLREALADDADRPVLIETVPRKGYRFIAPVKLNSSEPFSLRDRVSSQRPFGRKAILAIAIALSVVTVVLMVRLWPNRSMSAQASIEVVPLAGLPGFESEPAFSPDGNQVAFALHGRDAGIYTSMAGGGRPLRLTNNLVDCCPSWSPDGRQIVFSRASHDEVSLYVIPALGGAEHQVPASQTTMAPVFQRTARSVDWSPDGKILAFSENRADRASSWISLISLVDSTKRRLTSPPRKASTMALLFHPTVRP